jgi:prolyl 4-hydroxylase
MASLIDFDTPLVWTIPNILSPEECRALIVRVEHQGPAPAPITTAGGFVMRPDIRNNDRIIFDDATLAATLFHRARSTIPNTMFNHYVPVGANERFRCYRYRPGQRFAPHYDGSFRRNAHEESMLTFMVYLNDGFQGGDTCFLDLDERIVPKTGTGLLFQHRQLHEGCEVESGVKYVARTDVMFASRLIYEQKVSSTT